MRRVVHVGQDAPPLAGEGDQEVVAAARPDKTLGEQAAGQILAEGPCDAPRDLRHVRIPAARLLQPRFQMPLHHLIHDGTFRTVGFVHRGGNREIEGLGTRLFQPFLGRRKVRHAGGNRLSALIRRRFANRRTQTTHATHYRRNVLCHSSFS